MAEPDAQIALWAIFSITARSRMAAMIFSSPLPQFGQSCMSMSRTRA
ncbi:MAG TPA: hypothetical protein PLO41_08900 [Rubrivivax sp.]|nr:hypothetical protein [Rubrivivax sp.]